MRQAKLSLVVLTSLALFTAFFLTAEMPGRSGVDAAATPVSSSMPVNSDTIYAVTTTNQLLSFDSATPGTTSTPLAITGMQPAENVLGIDFRPATGQLYALGSTARIYTINRMTAVATVVSAGPFGTPLSGTEFGFDFDPTVDLIRVVSDAEQNFRVSPVNGAPVGFDTNLAYATGDPNAGANPNIVGAAYNNNFNGATSTTLFDIDSNLDALVRQGGASGNPSPNLGQLSTIGSLGVDTSSLVGFDISPSGVAFASLNPVVIDGCGSLSDVDGVSGSQLYTINLTTGAATLVGDIGSGLSIRDIAVFLPCQITCPANITKSNDPDQCGAVVIYLPPTTSGDCGTVTCSPASGSFFPVGTTTVTCKSNGGAGPEMCSFTVTVQDAQPPTITCPGNINAVAAASCPIATSTGPVNFTVTASDNCPGVTIICKDQNNQMVTSGQPLPVGTTTITCTATDASGNTASCSFTVTGFSFCLQDESSAGNVVLVNAQTGDYSFCCGGVPIASGRGTLTTRGCIGSIDHIKGDRQVHIQWDTSANNNRGAGTAYVQKSIGKVICQITDKNMSNNTCQCSNPPTPGSPKNPPKERTF